MFLKNRLIGVWSLQFYNKQQLETEKYYLLG